MGFTKLDEALFESSLCAAGAVPFAVFMLLLAKAKPPDGVARVSSSAIAGVLRITDEECLKAFAVLQAPDRESRSLENEGRRIERVDGGWLILNYWKYRVMRDPDTRREQNREAAKRWRAKRDGEPSVSHRKPSVSHRKPSVSQDKPIAEAEAEAEVRRSSSPLILVSNTIQESPSSVPSQARHVGNENDAVRVVFEYWKEKTGHDRAQWSDQRRRVLLTRLREEPGTIGQKVLGLMAAVDGALLDPLHNGAEKGRTYLEFENLFVHQGRNRIEKLQNVARGGDAPVAGARKVDDLENGNKQAVIAAIQKNRAMKGLTEGS